MSNRCVIVGSMDVDSRILDYKDDCFFIAADGGLKSLEEFGIKPDLVLGDFDSLGFIPNGDNVIQYPVKKNDTDMMLAVKEAITRGMTEIIIFGGCGGRADHTLANLSTMIYALKKGAKISMIDSDAEYYICSDEMILPLKEDYGFSVFAVGDSAKVDIDGALYSGENITVANDTTLGVSNAFTDRDVKIKVNKGIVMVVTTKE